MKKMIAIVALAASLSANAFFNNNGYNATVATKTMASLVITHIVSLLQTGSLRRWRICLMSSMVVITITAQEEITDQDIMVQTNMATTG